MTETLCLNPTEPATSRRFGVCAVDVCARARDYNTTHHNTSVTKFTFHDLT